MTLLWLCIGVEKLPMSHCEMTFTGRTHQNMHAFGYADVQTACALKLMISVMVPCRFVSMIICFTPWKFIMWANFHSHRMEASGF